MPALVVLLGTLGLALAVGVLAWEVHELRWELGTQVPSIGPRGIQEVLEEPLEGCDGKLQHVGNDARDFLLLYVFTPYDCPICQQELLDIETLAEERKDVGVYALMAMANRDEICQTAKNFGLTFPVLFDPKGGLASKLRAPDTPWKVLMKRDGNAGLRIVFEDPKSSTPDERRAFAYRVRLLLHP